MLDKTYNLMGGEIYVCLDAENKKLETEILNFSYQTLINLIDIFNFYDKNSSLSKLNQNKEIEYNFELAYLLNTSIKLYETTNGKFNIFLGDEIIARKNNEDLIQNNNKNTKIKLNPNEILTITKDKITLNNKNIKIDLGGIAKGYIVDRTIEITKEKYKDKVKTIFVDARGDIRVEGNGKYTIEVENPFNTEISFENIKLKNASIVTSGHNKQKFKSGSHIIGKPTDIYTITLVSKEIPCHILDALATYFILLPSEKTLKLIEFENQFKEIEALIILENGKVLKTGFWNTYK